MSYAPPYLPFRTPYVMDGDLPTVVTESAIFYPYSAAQIMVIRRRGDTESGTLMTHAEAKRALKGVSVPTPAKQIELLKEWNNAR